MSCIECHTGSADLGEVRVEVDQAREELGDELQTSVAALRAECLRKVEALEARVATLEQSKAAPPADESTPDKGEAVRDSRYELAASMWDAGLLLFLRKNHLFDQFVLVGGILLNLGLQLLFLSVVSCNMLDDEFGATKIGEMMRWRVQTGHSEHWFDFDRGDSRVRRLCMHELWSFEQGEYEDIYNYLYRLIPGQYLSLLAITLWVLSAMSEFRQCTSQLLSLVTLPRIGLFEDGVKESAPGEFEVIGISTAARCLAFILLFVPRLMVLLCLMVVGCKYLAQTITLSDIVLNTVALAFVLGADEHIAGVLLTERVRFIVQRLQPMRCGQADSTPARVRDALRYILAAGVIVFAYLFWLRPFVANVESAATTLCGGYLDFAYKGGERHLPEIVVMPKFGISGEYDLYCPAEKTRTYYNTFYPEYDYNGSQVEDLLTNESLSRTAGFSLKDRAEKILQYAYQAHTCGAGEIRGPPRGPPWEPEGLLERLFTYDAGRGTAPPRLSEGACASPGQKFSDMVPQKVQPGRDYVVEDCPRFNVSLREGACAELPKPEICQWSFEALACEDSHPGTLFELSCGADLWRACETWETQFNRSHPSKNCEITRHCRREAPHCMRMAGSFDIIVNHLTNLVGNESFLEEATGGALDASIHVVHRWQHMHRQVELIGASTGAPPCLGASMGAIDCVRVGFVVDGVGEDLTPAVLRRASAGIAAFMNGTFGQLGFETLVLGVVFNESFPTWGGSERRS